MKEINHELKQAVQKWKKNATQLPPLETSDTYDRDTVENMFKETALLEEEIDTLETEIHIHVREDLSDHGGIEWYDKLLLGADLDRGRIGLVEMNSEYPEEVREYAKRHGLSIIRVGDDASKEWEYEDYYSG